MQRLLALVFGCVVLSGCSIKPTSTGMTDSVWGPGVTDPDLVLRRAEAVVEYADYHEGIWLRGEDSARVIGMLSVLSWEQAAYVYRNATHTLKPLICIELIQGQQERFRGMTRDQITALLGEPEQQGAMIEEWGGAWAMTYTGYGWVSDSTPAIIIIFDQHGEFLRFGYPS